MILLGVCLVPYNAKEVSKNRKTLIVSPEIKAMRERDGHSIGDCDTDSVWTLTEPTRLSFLALLGFASHLSLLGSLPDLLGCFLASRRGFLCRRTLLVTRTSALEKIVRINR